MTTNVSGPLKPSACLAALLMTLQPLRAQVSELVATDDAGGSQAAFAGGIGSLEFYDNGLYWTVYGGSCSGEFTTHASLATLGFRNRPFPAEHYVALGCSPTTVGGAVRDDAFAYFTTPNGVHRKPVSANPGDASNLIGLFWNNLNPGAMMIFNNRAYYAYSSSSGQISGGGYFRIEYFELPGNGGLLEPITDVSNGSGLPNVGRIKKMGVVYRRAPDGSYNLTPYGLALTDGGYLLRFFLEQTIPQWRPAAIIATGATDFAVRREEFFSGDPFRLSYEEDTLYVSVGSSRCPADPASRLITLDPVSGATSTVFTAPDGYISAIGLDQSYLFVSTFGRRQLGGPFGGCDLDGAGVIRSKRWPASVFDFGSGVDPNWSAIEPFFAGDNLRSDGRFLFFTRGKELRRMPNNSPPVRHDFTALGFEVVQVVQDLNNSVRLVEGKRTIVRAYARVADSSLAQTDWFPGAQLRGWRNGVELPGPLFALNSPRITASGDFSVLRPDTSRSFQFELPAEWVRSGRLTLRFTVNPTLALYESGGNPLGNNSGEQGNLAVVQVAPPCFVFASIHSTTAPNYWPWENANDFARAIERAKSLLPVPDIHVHPTTERVSDEIVCLRTCDGPFGIPFPCGFVCNEPFDLTQNEDWNEALEELACYDSFDQNRPGCGRTHYVGAIHPAAMNVAWGGLGERPGTHFITFMSEGSLADINTPWAGRTIAHEFGHNLNRRHINQTMSPLACGGSSPDDADPSYPFDTCTIGQTNLANVATPLGFDVITFKPVRPGSAGDLMSYAPNRWPSIWTYNAMLDALGPSGPSLAPAAGRAPLGAGPYLLVRGALNLAQGKAKLKACYSLPDGVADPGKVQASLEAAAAEPAHGYRLRKLDAGGGLLEETPLVVRELEDADERTATINQFITKPAGMSAVQVLKDGVVLAECRASANEPLVNAVGAIYDPQGPSLLVTINATDPDADPLRFSIQFSNDDGATWRTLRANEGSLSFVVNPRFLPGGTQCRLRVIASDGFNSAVGLSEPFELPGRAPEPFIGGVRAGQRFPLGTTESLLGFALDAEDGSLPATALTWDLAGPTPRTGTGSSFSLHGLAPGVYTATLNASDADNNPGTSALTFEILPVVVVERAAPVVDGDANDAAYAGLPAVSLPLSPRTQARFLHAAGNLHVALTDLPYGGPIIRGRVGLYIDADASGENTPQAGDLVFYVDEDGVPEQYEGDGAQMVLKANPSPDFKAVISRGGSGWNAELRIADSLLGGWDHAARMGIFDQSAITTFVFGVPIDTPLFGWWPMSMGPNDPSTWAPAWFGNTLPAPANLPPVALVEAPRYLDMNGPTTVALNGTASYDPEGAPLTWVWTQLEGPAVTLEDSSRPTPSFRFVDTSPATFRFQLVVTDGELESTPAEVELILQPVSAQQVQLPPTTSRREGGSLEMSLPWPGRAGDAVTIQASTDLVAWEDITVATVSSLQTVLFTDAEAGVYPQRFYRLANGPSGEGPSSAATALHFDGVDDHVTVPHDPALIPFPMTVAFWLKTSDTGSTVRGLVSKYTDSSYNGYSLFLSDGRVRGWYFRDSVNYIWDGGLGLDGGFVADGQWHHIVLVVNEENGRLYVDGSLKSFFGWAGTPGAGTSSEPLQFGRYADYPVALNGQLDEIALWNRALTEAEVNQLVPGKLVGGEAGLVGFWSLDDGAGEIASDASGNAYNAALVNGPVWVASTAPLDAYPVAGSALRFDGVDDQVEVASADALNAFPLTITAWIKTAQNSPGYVSVANKYVSGSGDGYSLHIHRGRLYSYYFRGDGFSYVYAGDPGLDGGFIADGQWHHVAYAVDDAGARTYVDGVLTASLGWIGTPGPCTTATPLLFGPYPFGGQVLSFDGRIDDVTLWNRGLNAAEVNAVREFSVTGTESGLLGFWPFDEGDGGTAVDATGHGYDGTLVDGPTWVLSNAPLYP